MLIIAIACLVVPCALLLLVGGAIEHGQRPMPHSEITNRLYPPVHIDVAPINPPIERQR